MRSGMVRAGDSVNRETPTTKIFVLRFFLFPRAWCILMDSFFIDQIASGRVIVTKWVPHGGYFNWFTQLQQERHQLAANTSFLSFVKRIDPLVCVCSRDTVLIYSSCKCNFETVSLVQAVPRRHQVVRVNTGFDWFDFKSMRVGDHDRASLSRY